MPCCVGRLPGLMANQFTHQADEYLLLVAGNLARGGWEKYCSATGRNHQLMLKVFAYSITWKPVKRSTVLVPATDSATRPKRAIHVQDVEADGLVVLVSRRKLPDNRWLQQLLLASLALELRLCQTTFTLVSSQLYACVDLTRGSVAMKWGLWPSLCRVL